METLTKLNENEILGLLRTDKGGVSVVFNKKDGSKREMLCTLIESNIPADKQPKTDTEKEVSSTVGSAVRVFDIDKQEWRSFRWDSVISVNGI